MHNLYYNIYCSSASNYLFNVNIILTIYSKSDSYIYKVTLEHLKRKSNIHRISNLIWVFYYILNFHNLSRWLMESPNCILKRVPLQKIFYMRKVNHVKTVSMKSLLPNSSLRNIDVLKWTLISNKLLALLHNLSLSKMHLEVVVFLFPWLINPSQCFFRIRGHIPLDRNPGAGCDTLLLRLIPGDL